MGRRTRIIFKRDSESQVGRGAVTYGAHFRPEMALILEKAAYTAPHEDLELGEMWVTEGWRNIRTSRDLHKELRAFDISCTRIKAQHHPMRYTIADAWAQRLRKALGPSYQVVLHGGESNLHLHIELDP